LLIFNVFKLDKEKIQDLYKKMTLLNTMDRIMYDSQRQVMIRHEAFPICNAFSHPPTSPLFCEELKKQNDFEFFPSLIRSIYAASSDPDI